MTSSKRLIAVTIALVVIAATSACTKEGPKPTSAPYSTATTSTTPAPSTKSVSPAERDRQGAEDAIGKFWVVVDGLAADPYAHLETLTTVARDQSAAQWRMNLMHDRGNGRKQIGKTTVVSVVAKPSTTSGQFVVVACIDVGKVDIVDKAGKSVVAATRPPRVTDRYTVQKDKGMFYVTKDEATATC